MSKNKSKMETRRNFSIDFKAKVALEAIRGERNITELATKQQLHPNPMHLSHAAKLSHQAGRSCARPTLTTQPSQQCDKYTLLAP